LAAHGNPAMLASVSLLDSLVRCRMFQDLLLEGKTAPGECIGMLLDVLSINHLGREGNVGTSPIKSTLSERLLPFIDIAISRRHYLI
jgi:hypothetical protein